MYGLTSDSLTPEATLLIMMCLLLQYSDTQISETLNHFAEFAWGPSVQDSVPLRTNRS